jgi:hypothetical protein
VVVRPSDCNLLTATLVALDHRHLVLDGGEIGEDGFQGGLDVVTHGRREDQKVFDTKLIGLGIWLFY